LKPARKIQAGQEWIVTTQERIDVPIGEDQRQAYPQEYNRTAYSHLENTTNGLVRAGRISRVICGSVEIVSLYTSLDPAISQTWTDRNGLLRKPPGIGKKNESKPPRSQPLAFPVLCCSFRMRLVSVSADRVQRNPDKQGDRDAGDDWSSQRRNWVSEGMLNGTAHICSARRPRRWNGSDGLTSCCALISYCSETREVLHMRLSFEEQPNLR
jgi:hypothetical protein